MSRGAKIRKRALAPDPIYKSKIVARTINKVMLGGKKALAEKIVYYVLDNLSQDKKEAVEKFEQAVRNLMPLQEVRSRRVGGATYQVPTPVRHDRAESLAIKWLVEAARGRKGKSMQEFLLEEVASAFNKEGIAYRKKEEMHRMADANKAFAHFRW